MKLETLKDALKTSRICHDCKRWTRQRGMNSRVRRCEKCGSLSCQHYIFSTGRQNERGEWTGICRRCKV